MKLSLAAIAAKLTGCAGPTRGRNSRSNTPPSAQDRFWNMYKTNYLRVLPNNGGAILADGANNAISEAMGHAMFFAVERADWETFNALVQGLGNFRKANGLLRWIINADGSYAPGNESLNCATETEQNVANALLLAYEATHNEEYLTLALDLLNSIWQNATINFQGRRILLPTDTVNQYWPVEVGDNNPLCEPTVNGLTCRFVWRVIWSPTYFAPEHGRRFAQYDTRHNWDKVVVDWYELANMVLNAAVAEPTNFQLFGIGPMPDWVTLEASGTNQLAVATSVPGNVTDQWELDANVLSEMDTLRIPLYVSMDSASSVAQDFLTLFFAAIEPNVPPGTLIGEGSGTYPDYNPGPVIEIAAYGSGLLALGRDVEAYRARVQINENGSFGQTPDYYRDTVCYYSYLSLNGLFPY